MKFKEMPYERPDMEAVKASLAALTERLKNAASYTEARAVFLEQEEMSKHLDMLGTLVSIRHSIDTRDKFYDAEEQFWNAACRRCRPTRSSGRRPCSRAPSARISKKISAT